VLNFLKKSRKAAQHVWDTYLCNIIGLGSIITPRLLVWELVRRATTIVFTTYLGSTVAPLITTQVLLSFISFGETYLEIFSYFFPKGYANDILREYLINAFQSPNTEIDARRLELNILNERLKHESCHRIISDYDCAHLAREILDKKACYDERRALLEPGYKPIRSEVSINTDLLKSFWTRDFAVVAYPGPADSWNHDKALFHYWKIADPEKAPTEFHNRKNYGFIITIATVACTMGYCLLKTFM
jgi:hypothetical protein